MLDWECCHLGSAMEDLGWLCTRSWRFGHPELPVGGFGTREALFAGYTAGGGSVDPATVRWWEIFGLMRWAVLNIMQAHGPCFRRTPQRRLRRLRPQHGAGRV